MKTSTLTNYLESDAKGESPRRYAWYLCANLCSLDAPVVAVVWLWAFSRGFHSPVAWPVYAVLFLSVWAIYLLDRLLDTWRLKDGQFATGRHDFVRRHQKVFMLLLLVVLCVAAGLAMAYLPLDLLLAGATLSAAVAVYFAVFVKCFPRCKPLRAKEFACGGVFALGTALGVDAFRQGLLNDTLMVLPPVMLFASLCIYNCLIIAAREAASDRIHDPAAASHWWHQLGRDLLWLGLALSLLSAVVLIFMPASLLYRAIFLSSLCLSLAHFFQDRMAASLFRVLADAVLLSPLLFLI
ncbi:MAG: hypothetical protein L3J39_11305 [Verrucomicrobiales bacterium]|nr:hypothetical protein [Verrucomicrobiales bacterium]